MKDQFVCVEQFVCVSKGKIYSYEWEIEGRKCWSSEGWEEMLEKGQGGEEKDVQENVLLTDRIFHLYKQKKREEGME